MKILTFLGFIFVTVFFVHTITAQCGYSKTENLTIPYFDGASLEIDHDFPEYAVTYESARIASSDIVASFRIDGESQEDLDKIEVTYTVEGSKIILHVKGADGSTTADAGQLSVLPLGLLLGLVSLVLFQTSGPTSKSWIAILMVAILAVSFLPQGGIAEDQNCSKLSVSVIVPYELETCTLLCPSVSPTPTPTPSVTPSLTPSVTPSVVPSVTPSLTPTPSVTPSMSPTSSVTPSVTPSISVTPSVTPSISPSTSITPSITPTPSVTPSISPSNSVTPSITRTPSVTPSITPSNSVTPSVTPSNTPSRTSSPSRTPSRTPSVTPSITPSPSVTRTPSRTPSVTPSVTPSPVSPSTTPSISTSPSRTPSPVPVCGDGILQAGEICEDGNFINGDCCSSTCTLEGTLTGCESEPNNYAVTPDGPLTLPFNYSGSLRPASDDDFFTFTLSAATTLFIFGSSNFSDNLCGSFSTYNPSLDWGIQLWDPNGVYVYSLSGGNTYCPYVFQGPHLLPGTHTVRVFAEGGAIVPQYRLQMFALATCGNGAVEPGETCEPPTAHCNATSCLIDPYCGNGIVDRQLGEVCDDGNNVDGDCCSSTCNYVGIRYDCEQEPNDNCATAPVIPLPRTVAGFVKYPDIDSYVFSVGPTALTVNFMGGGTVYNSTCDNTGVSSYYIKLFNSNTNCNPSFFYSEANSGNGYYCPSLTSKVYPGNYTFQIFMKNAIPTAAYFVNATVVATCGNGIVEVNEVCEPPTLHCNPITCVWDPFCGDGGLNQPSELCDDGNLNNNDCCSSNCDYNGILPGCEKEPNNACGQVDMAQSDAYPPLVVGTEFMRRGTILNEGMINGYIDRDFFGFRTDAWSTVSIRAFNSHTNQTCQISTAQQTISIGVMKANCSDTQPAVNTTTYSYPQTYCGTLDGTKLMPPGNYSFRISNACGYCWNITEYQAFLTYRSYCGNGVVEAPETCDSPNPPCYNCALCGNGIIEYPIEVCDDGNTNSGDGCSSTCSQIEPGWVCDRIYNDTRSTCTVPLVEAPEPNSDCTSATKNSSANGNMFAWNATLNPGESDLFTLFVNKTGQINIDFVVYSRGLVGSCPVEWTYNPANGYNANIFPITNIDDRSICTNSPSVSGSSACSKTTFFRNYGSPSTFTLKLTAGSAQTVPVDYMAIIEYQLN